MNPAPDDELYAVLEAARDADAGALRAAYLRKIREYPPERDPEMFERVRDAYQLLSDPKRKMRRLFSDAELKRPLSELVPDSGGGRAFLGVAVWRELFGHTERRRRSGRGKHP